VSVGGIPQPYVGDSCGVELYIVGSQAHQNAYAKNYERQALPVHKERPSGLCIEVGHLAAGEFAFGPFRLLPEERVLLEGGNAVRVGGRALDILAALVVRSGTLISKEELISYAWPRARVEEANLRVHIRALRNALGENRAGARYIATVAGRGYCFVVPVHGEHSRAVPALPPGMSSTMLPVPITRMIGRDGAAVSLSSQMRTRRFVTTIGTGHV
jgi:DNA-binding winged helix-turn-helix (wHTH) protein